MVNLTQEVRKGEPVQIASKVLERPNANSAVYTCLFGFKQLLSYDSTNNYEVEVEEYDPGLGPYTAYYFMAGTNTDRTPILFTGGTQIEKTEDQLRSYAEQTQNITQGIDPFQNFPYEDGFSNPREWHPVKYYCANSDAC